MRNKIIAILIILATVLSVVVVASAGSEKKKPSPKTNELLMMLPASQMAMTIDTRRLFDEGLPQILSANQSMLAQFYTKIDQLRDKTGVDIRQFSQIAIGVSARQSENGAYSYEPMILARGKFSAESIIAIAKLAAGNAYREEKIGDRTVYVFSADDMVKDAKTQTGKTPVSGILDSLLDGLSREMAVTAIDGETFALGSLPQMRSMFEAKTKLDPEVAALVMRKPEAILSVGAIVPNGLSGMIDMDNDVLAKTLNSIRRMSGSMDVADGMTSVAISAKTADAAQAKDLKMTLDDLQAVGKMLLGTTKGADKRVYSRMVENAKITQTGTEVALDLKVPQADIDVLVGQLK